MKVGEYETVYGKCDTQGDCVSVKDKNDRYIVFNMQQIFIDGKGTYGIWNKLQDCHFD